MTILKYDYIYSKIIKFILNHLYKYTVSYLIKNESHNNFPIPISLNHLNSEVINYSIVCKKWFEEISYQLTNDIMNIHNYNLLNQFNDYNNKKNSIKNDNNNISFYSPPPSTITIVPDNEDYKLIKLNNSVKIYNSVSDYKYDLDNGITNKYRKIIVKVSYHHNENSSVIDIIKSNKELPNNVEFTLYITLFNESSLNDIQQFIDGINEKSIYQIHVTLYKRIFNNEQLIQQAFELISLLDSKYIFLRIYQEDDDGDYDMFHQHIKNTHLITRGNRLKYLNIYNDYFEPNDFSSLIYDDSNIKVLELKIPLYQMIKVINGQDKNKYFFNHSDTLLNDWNQLVNGITKIKSLKYLSLHNHAYYNERAMIFPSCITQGIKTILSNPSCPIQTLEFVDINFIDDNIIDGLNSNRSISTLTFHSIDPTPIIERVLTNNRTIKNLYFNAYTSKDIFKLFNIIKKVQQQQIQHQLNQQQQNNNNDNIIINLFNKLKSNLQQQYNNNIELYSITISSYEINEKKINQIINEINTNTFNIKEYNIFISDNEYTQNKQQQITNTNGTIINIINNKNNRKIYHFKH